MANHLLSFATALLTALLLGRMLIPTLRRLKAGQFIRQEGPQSHLIKAGTPTMGGFIFIIPWLMLVLFQYAANQKIQALVFSTLYFGAIGLIDDYIKVVLKRNLGLRAYQKVIGQLLGSFLLILMTGFDEQTVFIPLVNQTISLGVAYYPFVVFFIVAVTNSVNLTDGLDGLATSVTLPFLIVMSVIASHLHFFEITFSNGVLIFTLLGFLWYNRYPAQVFMGDVGSLAIGGYLAAMVMILKMHLLFVVVGVIYVIEALSVVLQVWYFRKTKKRLFKMAPIHHHFEQVGWKETTIVSVFTVVTGLFGLLGLWMVL